MNFLYFIISLSFSFNVLALELGMIHTPRGRKIAFFEKKKDYYLTEWDIMVEPLSKTTTQDEKANSRRFGKWKNGIIPYEIDNSIPDIQRIYQAIDYFHENTRIKLVKRTNESDFVYFKNNGPDECSSFVGRKGGKQNINISDWCMRGSIIHEILHALGFNHEQSRSDRWKYIKVHWSNIKLKYIHNYFLSPFSKNYGHFDMNSIMLYSSFSGFAKDPNKPTMSLKKSGTTWNANRLEMSPQDLQGLEEYYAKEFEAQNNLNYEFFSQLTY
jgi:hypothetical protein